LGRDEALLFACAVGRVASFVRAVPLTNSV
jgi:hypothetical protein